MENRGLLRHWHLACLVAALYLSTGLSVSGQSRCLQIDVAAPNCTSNRTVSVSGTVRTCVGTVTRLAYSLNGATPVTICGNCGPSQSFSFPVTLPAASGCADHVITFEATDSVGGKAFAKAAIRVDAAPPTLRCPSNVVVLCATGPDGALLEAPVAAVDDCPGPVIVICDPALGTYLQPGVTSVRCVAEDACGNFSAPCNFPVRVLSPATVNASPSSVIAGTQMLVSGNVAPGSPGVRILWSDGSNSVTIAEGPVAGTGAFSLNVNVPATTQPGPRRVQALAIGSTGCDLASTVVTVNPTPPSNVRGTVVERSRTGDQPIASAEVRLVKPDGLPIATTQTGSDGTYSFNNVGPGTYDLVILKDGFFFGDSSVNAPPGGEGGGTQVAIPPELWPAPTYVSFVGGVAVPSPLSVYNGSFPVLVTDQTSAKKSGIISMFPAMPSNLPALLVRFWAEVQFPGNPPASQRRVRFEVLDAAGNVLYAANKTAPQPVVANDPVFGFQAYTSTAAIIDLNAHSLPPGEVTLRVTPFIGNQAGYGKTYRIQVFDLGNRWLNPWVDIKPDPQTGLPVRVLPSGDLHYILNAELPEPDISFGADIPLGIHTFANGVTAKVPFQEVFIAAPGMGLRPSFAIPAELQFDVTMMDQHLVNESRKYQPKGGGPLGEGMRYEIGANTPVPIANRTLGPFTIYENGPGIHCFPLCLVDCKICGGYKIWVDVTFAAEVSLSSTIKPDLSLDIGIFTTGSGTLGGHFKAKAGVDIPGIGDIGCSGSADVTGTLSLHLPFRHYGGPTPVYGFEAPCVSLEASAGFDLSCVGLDIGADGNIGPYYWPDNCVSAAASAFAPAQISGAGPASWLPPNPVVAADGAGGAMAIWVQNESATIGGNSPYLYYSHFDGTSWSVSARLTPAAAAVGSPQLAFLAPNDAVAIWAQNKLSLSQIASDGKVELANQEIYFARWNGNVWTPPNPITSDQNVDASPVLAANPLGGSAMALWIRRLDPPPAQPSNNIMTVVSSTFDAGQWSAPTLIEVPYPALDTLASLAFDRFGTPWAVWQQHADGDLTTFADRRLLISTQSRGNWIAPEVIPDVPEGAFAPTLALDTRGQPLVVFTVPPQIADGSVGSGVGNRSTLWFAFKRDRTWEVRPVGMNVFAEDPAVRITPDNQATILFRRFSQDTSRLTGDVGAAVANLNDSALNWSLDYLTEDGQSNWQLAFAVDPETSRHFVLNIKQSPIGGAPISHVGDASGNTRGTATALQPGVNTPALMASHLEYRSDLAIRSPDIHFSNAYPVPGENITITANVRNLGLKPTDAPFAASFYEVTETATLIRRVVISNSLPLGIFPVSVPYLFREGGSKNIRVVVDEGNTLAESDETNNAAEAVIGLLLAPANAALFVDSAAGEFVLNWNAPTTNGVVKYSIYRASFAGGPFELIGSTTSTTFHDQFIQPGTEYLYAVAGTDKFNVSSAPSFAVPTLMEPPLKVRRAGAQIVLSWPSPSPGFELQQATVVPGGRWTTITQMPVVIGNENQLTLPAVQAGGFYRLRKP